MVLLLFGKNNGIGGTSIARLQDQMREYSIDVLKLLGVIGYYNKQPGYALKRRQNRDKLDD